MAKFARWGRSRPHVVLAGALAAVVLALSGMGYATAFHYGGQINHVNAFDGLTERPAEGGGTNILVVGSDDRSELSDEQQRTLHVGSDTGPKSTDTMVLLHLSSDGSIGAVSIPRDSYVELPAHTDSDGVPVPAAMGKISSALAAGGAPLVVNTVERATGVRIDHYAEVDFAGFSDVVSALEGVDVCTPSPLADGLSGLDIPAGRSTLDGPAALAFVRARSVDPTDDFGRMRRQQAFLASAFKRATSPGVLLNPAKFTDVTNALFGSLTTDPGLDTAGLFDLSQRARTTSPDKVTFQTIPVSSEQTIDGVGSVLTWDARAGALFDAMQSDTPLPLPDVAAGKPTPVEIPTSKIDVQLVNASGDKDLLSRAGDDFDAAGYIVNSRYDNGGDPPQSATTIFYDPTYDSALDTVKASLPGAAAKPLVGLGGTYRIQLGADYRGLQPVVSLASGPDAVGTTTDKQSAAVAGAGVRTAADDICGQ